MKKILIFMLGMLFCSQAFSQVNVDAGYLNSRYRSGSEGYSVSINGNGVFAGISTDCSLGGYGQFAFTPGLRFNYVNYKITDGVNAIEYILTIPLHIKFTQPLDGGTDFYVSAGPSLLWTLGGKSKASYEGLSYSESIKGGDFDLPLGLEAGLKFSNSIRILLGYDFGLINQAEGDNTYKVTRNTLYVGLGYTF